MENQTNQPRESSIIKADMPELDRRLFSGSRRRLYDSRKGLLINEAYLGYLAGHPVAVQEQRCAY